MKANGATSRRFGRALCAFVAGVSLAGCLHTPHDAFQPPATAQTDETVNTRFFDGLTDPVVLSACVAALQDLGFTIDESEGKVGLIVATKDRSAKIQQTAAQGLAQATLEVAASVALTVLTAHPIFAHDDDPPERQVIRASLTAVRDAGSRGKAHVVRIGFERVVYSKKNHRLSAELLHDPELAQGFFDALSKSIFLAVQAP